MTHYALDEKIEEEIQLCLNMLASVAHSYGGFHPIEGSNANVFYKSFLRELIVKCKMLPDTIYQRGWIDETVIKHFKKDIVIE